MARSMGIGYHGFITMHVKYTDRYLTDDADPDTETNLEMGTIPGVESGSTSIWIWRSSPEQF